MGEINNSVLLNTDDNFVQLGINDEDYSSAKFHQKFDNQFNIKVIIDINHSINLKDL